MLRDVFGTNQLKPQLKKELLCIKTGRVSYMSPVTITWDETKSAMQLSDGFFSIRAHLASIDLAAKLVGCNKSTERVMVAILKNFEFQMEQSAEGTRKAVVIIKELTAHMLNDEIEWVLLKEC
jgi:hypothetical protein